MKKKLEKLMYMGLGALIAFGGYLFGTLQNDNADAQFNPANVEYNEIRCRNLKVVDADGNTLIDLTRNFGGGIVKTFAASGHSAVNLGHTLDNDLSYTGGAILVSDKDGRQRIVLSTHKSGGALQINGKDGQKLIELTEVNTLGGRIIGYDRLNEPKAIWPPR